MLYFLIEYDRPAGEALQVREFESRDEAYALRNKLELAKESHIEVVVLEGDSLDAIMHTHRRYFYSLEELSI